MEKFLLTGVHSSVSVKGTSCQQDDSFWNILRVTLNLLCALLSLHSQSEKNWKETNLVKSLRAMRRIDITGGLLGAKKLTEDFQMLSKVQLQRL